jgi:hypothetical protein
MTLPRTVKSVEELPPEEGGGSVIQYEDADEGSAKYGGAGEEPSTPKAARGLGGPAHDLKTQLNASQQGIEGAAHTSTGSPGDADVPPVVHSEPAPPYAAQYPYNKVVESESGQVMEMDDTPGAERINLQHATGSFVEMHPSGDKVSKTVNNDYLYVLGNSFTRVVGTTAVVSEGAVTVKCSAGDITIQAAGGNMNITVNGNVNMNVSGSFNHKVGGDYNLNVGGKMTVVAGPEIDMDAGIINLN